MYSVTYANLMFSAFEEIGKRSQALLEKKTTARFFDKAKDSQEVVTLVEQLRATIVYYQVRGDYATQTSVNTRRIGIATTVDIQSDRAAGCKASHQSCL